MTPALLPCPLCGEPADFGRTAAPGRPPGVSTPFVNCTGCLAAIGLLMPDEGATEQDLADQWNNRTGGAAPMAGLPGLLVLEASRPLTPEQRDTIQRMTERALPRGATLLVLEPGIRLARPDIDAMARIEQKLDALLQAIEDADPDPDAGADPTANLDSPTVHAPPTPTL